MSQYDPKDVLRHYVTVNQWVHRNTRCREYFLFTSGLFFYDHVGIFGFYLKYLKMRGFVSFVKFKLFFVPSKFSSDF